MGTDIEAAARRTVVADSAGERRCPNLSELQLGCAPAHFLQGASQAALLFHCGGYLRSLRPGGVNKKPYGGCCRGEGNLKARSANNKRETEGLGFPLNRPGLAGGRLT
jgi:hypothetical protein